MIIRLLQEKDAEDYWALRLEALQRSPDAYGSTYEKEAAFDLLEVRERVRPDKGKFVLGAFDDGGRMGAIVTLVRDAGPKSSHKGFIYGMYVAEGMRGQGVGRKLLKALIERAGGMEGLEQIHLTVVTHNASAIKLYDSLGFQFYGLERRSLKHNGVYTDEHLMMLPLNDDFDARPTWQSAGR